MGTKSVIVCTSFWKKLCIKTTIFQSTLVDGWKRKEKNSCCRDRDNEARSGSACWQNFHSHVWGLSWTPWGQGGEAFRLAKYHWARQGTHSFELALSWRQGLPECGKEEIRCWQSFTVQLVNISWSILSGVTQLKNNTSTESGRTQERSLFDVCTEDNLERLYCPQLCKTWWVISTTIFWENEYSVRRLY